MADTARSRILWMRKVHPVVDPASVRGELECLVRITNTGTATWTADDYEVRAHLDLADGRYVEDPVVNGATLTETVAPSASLDMVISILSEPDTADVTSAALFHPDTLVTVDVVFQGATWLGEDGGALVGQCYLRDAVRDRPVDVEAAASRLGLRDTVPATATVPTSGDEQDVLFRQLEDGRTLYLLGLMLSTTEGTQQFVLYGRPSGGSEAEVARYRVSASSSMAVDLRKRRLNTGDQYRLAVTPNPDSGIVSASLDFIELPWEEQL